jgi:hypothetical protein
MKRHQRGLNLRYSADIMSDSSGLLKMLFKLRLERTVYPLKYGDPRMFHLLVRELGADRTQNYFTTRFERLHVHSDL